VIDESEIARLFDSGIRAECEERARSHAVARTHSDACVEDARSEIGVPLAGEVNTSPCRRGQARDDFAVKAETPVIGSARRPGVPECRASASRRPPLARVPWPVEAERPPLCPCEGTLEPFGLTGMPMRSRRHHSPRRVRMSAGQESPRTEPMHGPSRGRAVPAGEGFAAPDARAWFVRAGVAGSGGTGERGAGSVCRTGRRVGAVCRTVGQPGRSLGTVRGTVRSACRSFGKAYGASVSLAGTSVRFAGAAVARETTSSSRAAVSFGRERWRRLQHLGGAAAYSGGGAVKAASRLATYAACIGTRR
jgi:hypothetical protein